MSEPNSGIQGMREALQLALEELRALTGTGTETHTYIQLASKFAELADLEMRVTPERDACAEPVQRITDEEDREHPEHDGIHEGPASAWTEYLPWLIVYDSHGDSYVVVAYTHLGVPMLSDISGCRLGSLSRDRAWSARTATAVANDYGPLTVTDQYLGS